MMDPTVQDEIQARLDALEAEHDIRVIYACESGSRAWGFASTDSDYDVRFLYAHSHAWYLSLDLQRRSDTLDVPITDDLDLHGWDVRKALQLFRKSNPPLLEWLQSPIVYRQHADVMERWRSLLPTYYTPIAAGYHYLHMAQGNYTDYLKGNDRIWIKKYLYVLRPLLGIRWIEQRSTPVPTEFARLVDAGVTDADLRDAIDRLLTRKRSGEELDEGPRLPLIHAFIADELNRLEDTRFASPDDKKPLKPLNRLFRDIVRET